MRQSIIDGAPETASSLAQQALASGIAPLEAINNGYLHGREEKLVWKDYRRFSSKCVSQRQA
jgi:methanogenic corrinoid protein MtbC1